MTRRVRSILDPDVAGAPFGRAVGTAVDAQPADSLPQWVRHAHRRLGLEPDQQRELRRLVDENTERLHEIRMHLAARDSTTARRARRAAVTALQHEFRCDLMQILTPDQLAEWDALLEELLGEIHVRVPPAAIDRTH